MRTIEVEEDVYAHIKDAGEIGEAASSILRRLLGLNGRTVRPTGQSIALHEFAAAMKEPNFVLQTSAVDKFLFFLGWAYADKKVAFEKILAIRGRDRRYFAKSREEIEKSGNSTQPRKIPGSPFWVMTNSPTPQKKQMLRDALNLLGYSPEAINAAVATIR